MWDASLAAGPEAWPSGQIITTEACSPEAWNHGLDIAESSPFMAETFRLVKYEIIFPDMFDTYDSKSL